MNMRASAEEEQQLITEILDPQISENPYRFVKFVYPWGKENTPLHKFKEPRNWQIDELLKIADHLQDNKTRIAIGENPEVYQSAMVSGRGPGKSALTAWIDHWLLSTQLGATVINTANTESQLKTKTWAEVGRWHAMAINGHWFEKMALSVRPAPWFEQLVKNQLQIDTGYYYAQAILWDEKNPDAFAGAHSQYGTCVVFDEASGIPKPIWTVTEGFFTDLILHRYWFVFSNGRRNTGPFFECFHKYRKYWHTRQLDSRTVEGIDHKRLQEIVDKYGEDSDEARVEVKGEFPRLGDLQFISREVVQDAMERQLEKDDFAALIMGVDPARYGDAETVIRYRQGRDARSIPPKKLKGLDNMTVANIIAEEIEHKNPDAVCIDAGNGTGIIDRLRERGFRIHEVWFGKKSENREWADKRTELWASLREWLKGGCIDVDDDLKQDLVSPEYLFVGAGDRIKLESKDSLRKRGFASPDNADALALTFAVKVARRDSKTKRHSTARNRQAKDVDYPVI